MLEHVKVWSGRPEPAVDVRAGGREERVDTNIDVNLVDEAHGEGVRRRRRARGAVDADDRVRERPVDAPRVFEAQRRVERGRRVDRRARRVGVEQVRDDAVDAVVLQRRRRLGVDERRVRLELERHDLCANQIFNPTSMFA